ncbi:MAG: hypothetical protein PHI48_07870 [Bacteroidales bacterium]|nr:hypothetical protein [Bacteroidales bacterium]
MKQGKKITLSREIEARDEINRTSISHRGAKCATIVFIVLLILVPLVQIGLDYSQGKRTVIPFTAPESMHEKPFIQRVFASNKFLIEWKTDWEKQLEEESFLRDIFPAPFQWFMTAWMGTGNEKAIIGKEGWMYYAPDILYLTGKAIDKSSVECIADFARQLKQRNIELVLMPVPLKPMIYPEHLTERLDPSSSGINNSSYQQWRDRLKAKGIRIVDVAPILHSMKMAGISTYLKTDTHWTPEAMERVAGELARYLSAEGLANVSNVIMTCDTITRQQYGDIYTMLKMPYSVATLSKETAILHPVLTESGEYWQPSQTAPILFMGDSFSNIYSLEGMGWGNSGGFAEQLSYYLQQQIDAIRRNDEGSIATRLMLQKELLKGRDRLAGKRVVVWEFAMRELTSGNWESLDLTLGEAQPAKFLTLAVGDSVIVSATIADRSASPHPDKVTYADHVFALHLTDLQRSDGKEIGQDAVVYLLGMKERKLTPASYLRVGERITLKLSNWQLAEPTMGALNRNELTDMSLQLEEPLWGELITK